MQGKTPILTGQKYGSYKAKPWHLRGVTLRVMDTKCGSGNCWLGIYTLYYIYVGDMNPSREIRRMVETRRGASLRRGVLSGCVGDAPRHVSTLGMYP